ncbi:hypothetical protein [Alteribacillus iranensis]|uniref:Uncharacterized protein n=1 Tax=Alteribacillus iranensis TaxID=930128 RepID=A0A1I2A1D0_9BACI|nr:hypothetical protein [Alteribacillus iranensis]SFE37378.1 hypothetical protein SAMN05192532_101577 [Alteribacillus iranensis]
MFSKLKKLNSQEWGILLLFIISILCLVLTVKMTGHSEGESTLPVFAEGNNYEVESPLTVYNNKVEE